MASLFSIFAIFLHSWNAPKHLKSLSRKFLGGMVRIYEATFSQLLLIIGATFSTVTLSEF